MKNSFISRPAFYALHVLFWLCYGAILYASLSNWIDSPYDLWKALLSDVLASSIIAYSNYYLLLPKVYSKGKYGIYILVSIGLIILVVLFRVHIQGLTHKSVSYTYFIRSVPAIGFYLSSTVVWFIVNLILAQRNEIELRNSQLASELKFLKLQLSPHFLFNTLNNIYSMAYFKDKMDENEVSQKIRMGGGAMPGYAGVLTDAEHSAVMAFLYDKVDQQPVSPGNSTDEEKAVRYGNISAYRIELGQARVEILQ